MSIRQNMKFTTFHNSFMLFTKFTTFQGLEKGYIFFTTFHNFHNCARTLLKFIKFSNRKHFFVVKEHNNQFIKT